MTCDKGDAIRLSATFKNSSGVVADPSTVQLKVRTPAGAVTLYSYADGDITKDSTGVYHMDMTPTAFGKHTFSWIAGGTIQAQEDAGFFVRYSTVQ